MIPKGTLIRITDGKLLTFESGMLLLVLSDAVNKYGAWFFKKNSILAKRGIYPRFETCMYAHEFEVTQWASQGVQ